MTKPRILIFSVAYEPLVGGAELAVRNITDRIADVEFDLVTVRFNRAHPRFEKIGNVNIYRVGFGSRIGRLLYPALAFRAASKLHESRDYQVVWAIMAAYAGAAALLFLRHFPGVKFLLTLQEGDSIQHIHKRVWGFKRQWQTVFRRADYIQAISRFLADWAVAEGATCPMEVVPNGVAVRKFQIPNVKSPNFGIITVSRLVPKNGIDILIRAVAALKVQLPTSNFQLLIAGIGPEEAKLKKLAADLRITDQVEFLGNVSQEKLPEYLAGADIFVRPSRSEGLGTAFLEAMSAGLPVVATPVGGIPDFLIDHETGLFAKKEDPRDLAEKLQLLMQDSGLKKILADNGRRLVSKKYNWDIIASQMNQIFHKLL